MKATEKAADYYIKRKSMTGFDVDENHDGERYLSFDENRRIIADGKDLLPLTREQKETWFIQAKYLKPLTDVENLQLFLRDGDTDRPYIVAKDGFFVVAVIVPAPMKQRWLTWLRGIYEHPAQIGGDDE